ncbi:MAG: endonuclease MutS2 [Chloroflexi bacterium CFX1]|nr:endonuclease MutS2 [Chloroflexi bacterium CFX1]MCQ3953807.1 endonuclease MutS2 [Chloroflexota bacterium]MDL1920818.1 endonuclease MutS2 [Chloroflexi bacterium CFX5]NUQ60000.1 endonuclease MutS2 [Anaerolineales bacterium]
MDSKTLNVLEYPKILEKLAGFCDFSASMALARSLEPTDSYDLAVSRIAETTEARRLFSIQDVSVGAAHDIRAAADLAARGGVLDPQALLDVKSTLIACRELKKTFEKKGGEYPRLCLIAQGLPETYGIVDAISRILSDRGEVLDSASVKLADIRRKLRIAHDRLMSRLQKYITDSHTASMLQEAIITQRDGRYVIPLRAEFKGRIKAVVHDQSSSGATLFVEPLPVVEANNEIRELQLAGRDEERRILAEVSSIVGEHAAELKYGVENLAALDLAFAKAKYGESLRGSEPVLHNAESRRQKEEQPSSLVTRYSSLKLLQARHPLLDPETVVPIDVDPAEGTRAIVITGPNTGGKTVSLKTVGLLALMAQSGLHIPAQSGSELPFFKSVYADIGDEQSIEQSLSTFSGHITNIIRILKQIDGRSLVIFDELGSGTDPQEGAAIARAILSHLLEVGCATLVATHYPELKTFAHSTGGVVNASLEFDIKTLRPTYKLTIGLPGRSNALAIAQKLGLPGSIIESAKAEINPLDLRADKLLDDIRRERNRASREREKLEKQRAKIEAQNAELQKRLEKIEDERRETLAKARAEGELEAAVLKRNINSLKSQLKKAQQPLNAIKAIEEKIEAIEGKATQPVERKPDQSLFSNLQSLKLGERVAVSTLNAEGIVTALGESDAEVQIGTIRVRAKMSDLVRRQTADAGPSKEKSRKDSSSAVNRPSSTSPGMEVDLRGLMAEDALDKMERYLEQAYLAGLPWVRIIHGKGTGKLRQAVREALKGHAYVKSFEEGGHTEGGEGVTVAKLNAN